MRPNALWILMLALLIPAAATAEVFTIVLDNGRTLKTRYKPKVNDDESKVLFLTETGNWVAVPRDRVADVEIDTELKGYGLVIDTTTISMGFAPNETKADPDATLDSSARLLNYLQSRDSQRPNYSVEQFVNSEAAGSSGFPSSFGAGTSSPGLSSPGFAFGAAAGSAASGLADSGGSEPSGVQ